MGDPCHPPGGDSKKKASRTHVRMKCSQETSSSDTELFFKIVHQNAGLNGSKLSHVALLLSPTASPREDLKKRSRRLTCKKLRIPPKQFRRAIIFKIDRQEQKNRRK